MMETLSFSYETYKTRLYDIKRYVQFEMELMEMRELMEERLNVYVEHDVAWVDMH